MKPGQLLRAALIVAAVVVVGFAGTEQASAQGFAARQRFRYANGDKISQRYWQPASQSASLSQNGKIPVESVIEYSEKLPPVANSPLLRLSPNSILHIPIRTLHKLQNLTRMHLHGSKTHDAQQRQVLDERQLDIFEFDLTYRGVPITKGSRTFLVKDGHPVAIRDRNYPSDLHRLSTQPTVAFHDAHNVAMQDAREMFDLLYPDAYCRLSTDGQGPDAPRLVVWNDPETHKAHLAWACRLHSVNRSHPFLRRYWVDAHGQARILDYEDQIIHPMNQPRFIRTTYAEPAKFWTPQTRFNIFGKAITTTSVNNRLQARTSSVPPLPQSKFDAQFSGPVSGVVVGTIWENSPFAGMTQRGLPEVEVTVTHRGIPRRVRTDKHGRFSLHHINGDAQFQVSLSGPGCRVINHMPPQAAAAPVLLHVTGKNQVQVSFPAAANEESKLAQTTAYVYVTEAYNFVSGFTPSHPRKLANLKTNVNIDDSCNAYYDLKENSLNFYRASVKETCPNTAYRDVIFHEYGHAVDDEFGGVLDAAYSEGFGDSLSVMMTRAPIVGRDFYGPPGSPKGGHLRDVSRVVMYTSSKDAEIHEAGMAYAGFTWELLKHLSARYGSGEQAVEVCKQLILGAAAENPKDIPDAVRLSFHLDSVLFPGQGGHSMHYNELRAAALSRGIPVSH